MKLPLPGSPLIGGSCREYRFITNAGDADQFCRDMRVSDICAIAFDTEHTYEVSQTLSHGKSWQDPTTVIPWLLSVSLGLPQQDGSITIRNAVFDLRNPDLKPAIQRIMDHPAPKIAHFVWVDWNCLRKYGIEIRGPLVDTLVMSRLTTLGLTDACDPEKPLSHGLLGVCKRYGVNHAYSDSKDQLQRSFIDHQPGADFSQEQLAYAMEDALATLQIYFPLQNRLQLLGLTRYFWQVEVPATTTLCEIQARGLLLDMGRISKVTAALTRAMRHFATILNSYNVTNPDSDQEVYDQLVRLGLGGHFMNSKNQRGFAIRHEQLENHRTRHPFIEAVYRYRKARDLANWPVWSGLQICRDGRVRPGLKQLGADTTRITSSAPNMMGIGKNLRPVVIAEAGLAIVELDLSQIEMLVAAAFDRDPAMLNAGNSGDIYSELAKTLMISKGELAEADSALSWQNFKIQHKKQRDEMKLLCLGNLYGLTPYGAAPRLGCSEEEARQFQEEFFSLFPTLCQNIEERVNQAMCRGYALAIEGVRQYTNPRKWTVSQRRTFQNFPIQASAAVVFKKALVDVQNAIRHLGASVILPVYDAMVIEAPQKHLAEVARIAEELMISAVRHYFPALLPRVDINLSQPHCWNKDGHADSIDRLLQDPLFTL